MSARTGRISIDSVGTDATGAALHAESLAGADYYPRCVSAFALRDLANLARLAYRPERIRSWIETAGVAGSMALGAVMLGYYVAYSAGVRWQLRQRNKTL